MGIQHSKGRTENKENIGDSGQKLLVLAHMISNINEREIVNWDVY